MRHIYYISGFGADERVFSKLNFGYPAHFIPWLNPLTHETIEEYAKRMSEKIEHDDPILLGLSFGGIMCIEIAKILPAHKVILISSVKTYHEIPSWMRLVGKSKLDRFFPLKSFRVLEPIQNYNLGIENDEELQLVREYRANIGRQFTEWGIHQVVNWKNEWQSANCIQVHGGKDHIFPLKNIKADYVIPDGGHFMIMNRAEKVSEILKEILE